MEHADNSTRARRQPDSLKNIERHTRQSTVKNWILFSHEEKSVKLPLEFQEPEESIRRRLHFPSHRSSNFSSFHSPPCSSLTPPTPPSTTLKAKKRLYPPGNHQRVELFTLFLQQWNMATKRPSARPQLLKLQPHRPLLNQVLD